MSAIVNIPCRGCNALNRILRDRLRSVPTCGKCGQDLIPQAPIPLTRATFKRFIERSDLPVLINFRAPWCPHCTRMAPEFERASRMLTPLLVLATVDTQTEEAIAAHYRIESIPTTVLFRNGKETARLSGAQNAEHIASWVRRFVEG